MTGVIIIKQRVDYKVLEDLKGVGVLWGSVSRLSGFDSRAKHERTTDWAQASTPQTLLYSQQTISTAGHKHIPPWWKITLLPNLVQKKTRGVKKDGRAFETGNLRNWCAQRWLALWMHDSDALSPSVCRRLLKYSIKHTNTSIPNSERVFHSASSRLGRGCLALQGARSCDARRRATSSSNKLFKFLDRHWA